MQISTIAFDVSTFGDLGALLQGAARWSSRARRSSRRARPRSAPPASRVAVLHRLPSTSWSAKRPRRRGAPASLREVSPAARRAASRLEPAASRGPDSALVNGYGPTETHGSRAHPPGHRGRRRPARSPIGRPIADTAPACRSTASCGRCRSGAPGELCLGGERRGARLSRPPGADRRALRPRPFVPEAAAASASTAPATSRASCRTAPSSSWAGRPRR